MGLETVEAVDGVDREVLIAARDLGDALVLANVELIMLGDFAVVLEGLGAGGFLVRGGERQIADFEQLRRGEEGHVGRVVEERVGETAFVDENHVETFVLRVNRAGETGGAGADDENVVQGFLHGWRC